ncbi:hypothetical protein PspLS_04719 [Pyricularia sp. CBS 133598]|nr:hypothetical protein PspLS_04719 [Pyricularia sp. CBS 133598]
MEIHPSKLSRVAPDGRPISQPFAPLNCWCGVSLFVNGGRTSPDWLAPSGEGSRVAQWNSRGRRLAPSDWSAGVFLPDVRENCDKAQLFPIAQNWVVRSAQALFQNRFCLLTRQVDLPKKQIGNALERMFEVTADTQTPLPWDG